MDSNVLCHINDIISDLPNPNALCCINDIISDLPDPILVKILSYLPTKNAVDTSILSTHWKNIFPIDLPLINIDLDESLLLHPKQNESEFISTSFIDFVDKLLNQTLRNVHRVDIFTLKCEKQFEDYYVAKFTSWICALVRYSVQELRVRCCLNNTYSLFNGIIGCTTLTRLELKAEWKDVSDDGMLAFYIEPEFSLPTLKIVDLFSIGFHDEYYQHEGDLSTLMMFINACPKLEELSLTDCDLEGIWDLRITSHVLKILKIQNSLVNKHHITINTPNLELLSLNNGVAHNYCIYPLNSLRLGHNDDKPWYYESVRDLVYDCRKTKHLYLALSSIEHLPYANKQLPEIQNLTNLSLASVRSEGWVVLACLLNNAPNLEQLTFEEEFGKGDIGFVDFQRLFPSPPTCLELHIKNVEFRHFGEKEDEIKLLNYFVQNGKVLEKVVRNSVVLLLPIKR